MLEYAQRIGQSLKLGLGLRPQARPLGVPIVVASRWAAFARRTPSCCRSDFSRDTFWMIKSIATEVAPTDPSRQRLQRRVVIRLMRDLADRLRQFGQCRHGGN